MHGRWVALAAAAMLTAGCSGGVEGTAVAGAPAEAFDPCSIPDTAIAATGLDPNSKQVGWGEGITVKDWTHCAWSGPKGNASYYLNIRSSQKFNTDDARQDTSYKRVSDPTIGGRNAFQYIADIGGRNQECSISMDTEQGVVNFLLYEMGGLEMPSDACETVLRHAKDLEQFIPATN